MLLSLRQIFSEGVDSAFAKLSWLSPSLGDFGTREEPVLASSRNEKMKHALSWPFRTPNGVGGTPFFNTKLDLITGWWYKLNIRHNPLLQTTITS